MNAQINQNLLEEKLAQLEKARSWSPRVISRLETLIHSSDEFSLFRINPVQFGMEKGIDESEAIELFLYAAKLGLFQMNWQLLCPGCSSVLKSFSTLKTFDSHLNCNLCQVDVHASLDDYIEISFTIAPLIRDIIFNHPEDLSIDDFFFKYQFSRGASVPIPGNPLFVDAVKMFIKAMTYVAPGETKKIELEISAGLIAGIDRINMTEFFLNVSPDSKSGTQNLSLKIINAKFNPASGEILSGKVGIEIENKSAKRSAIAILWFPPDYQSVQLTFAPFLAGKKLITSQVFRDLFHSETIRSAEGLGVKDITVLFTDLKGSTALYDRIGDLKAFALVQQHFDRLGKVIQTHSGAVVKTIGDAVMASFMNPVDATKAALLMLEEINRFNQEYGDRELILKIGIHKGTSIVVTLNDRLDFFGQTVNIASRVQGLADAEEIFITQDVYGYPKVKELLQSHEIVPSQARLKGIQEEMQVYKISHKQVS